MPVPFPFIAFPRTIPPNHGAGCLAIRVIEPITPLERELTTAAIASGQLLGVTPPLWRIILWFDGHIYFVSTVLPEPPTLAAVLDEHRKFPLSWSELVVPTQP
ncbi:MAG: hypothetical protein V4773_27700 [Verrucomicrobiota bacterium]